MAALMAALGRAAEIPLRACRRVLHGLGQSHHTDVIARHLSAPGRVVACKQGMLASVLHDVALVEDGRGRRRAGGAVVASGRRRGARPAGGAHPRRGHRSLTIARRRASYSWSFRTRSPEEGACVNCREGCSSSRSRSRRSPSRPAAVAAARARRRRRRRQHAGGRHAAEGRHPHHPRELGVRRRRPGPELHAPGVGAPDRHPRRARRSSSASAARRGTQLVPDLADRDPAADRRRQDVHLPASARASSSPTARRMKPSDFVTTFERQFTVPGPTSFYSGIVGADKCTAKNCDLSQGVVADDNAYTLTIHLVGSGSRVPLQAGAAVRIRGSREHVAQELTGNDVPPGTGPYMWQSYDPNKEAVLVRNPNFKVWNPDAQPEGYPDKIVEKYGLPGLRRGDRGRERPGRPGVRRRHDSRPTA